MRAAGACGSGSPQVRLNPPTVRTATKRGSTLISDAFTPVASASAVRSASDPAPSTPAESRSSASLSSVNRHGPLDGAAGDSCH